jgi:lipoprotein NlpI
MEIIFGRQAESDEAMSRLQRLEPNPRWYDARAYEGFKRGNYSTAIHDIHTYIERAGRGAESAPYAAFLGAICYLRLKKVTEASNPLREISTEIPEGSWTAVVMDFMQGKLSSEKFLARAKDVYERTEAHAYTGMMALIAGDRDEGLNHLHWVKDKGSRNYVEYGMAIAELKRLEADDLKPGARNNQ